MNRIMQKVNQFFRNRYGMDELGKVLTVVSIVCYLLAAILKNKGFESIGICLLVYELFRMLSKRHWERAEENKVFMRYIKFWKLKYKERKTSRIYLCKRCKRFIRVPRGKGKIEVTCTACGDKTMRRS